MTEPHVPMLFDSLTIEQMQAIESRSILTNDNTMRFDSLKAARGDELAQRRVMLRVKADPSWIQVKS